MYAGMDIVILDHFQPEAVVVMSVMDRVGEQRILDFVPPTHDIAHDLADVCLMNSHTTVN